MGADTLMTGNMALLGYCYAGTLLHIWTMKSVESIGGRCGEFAEVSGRRDWNPGHVRGSISECLRFPPSPITRTWRQNGFGRSFPLRWINTGLCN